MLLVCTPKLIMATVQKSVNYNVKLMSIYNLRYNSSMIFTFKRLKKGYLYLRTIQFMERSQALELKQYWLTLNLEAG